MTPNDIKLLTGLMYNIGIFRDNLEAHPDFQARSFFDKLSFKVQLAKLYSDLEDLFILHVHHQNPKDNTTLNTIKTNIFAYSNTVVPRASDNEQQALARAERANTLNHKIRKYMKNILELATFLAKHPYEPIRSMYSEIKDVLSTADYFDDEDNVRYVYFHLQGDEAILFLTILRLRKDYKEAAFDKRVSAIIQYQDALSKIIDVIDKVTKRRHQESALFDAPYAEQVKHLKELNEKLQQAALNRDTAKEISDKEAQRKANDAYKTAEKQYQNYVLFHQKEINDRKAYINNFAEKIGFTTTQLNELSTLRNKAHSLMQKVATPYLAEDPHQFQLMTEDRDHYLQLIDIHSAINKIDSESGSLVSSHLQQAIKAIPPSNNLSQEVRQVINSFITQSAVRTSAPSTFNQVKVNGSATSPSRYSQGLLFRPTAAPTASRMEPKPRAR